MKKKNFYIYGCEFSKEEFYQIKDSQQIVESYITKRLAPQYECTGALYETIRNFNPLLFLKKAAELSQGDYIALRPFMDEKTNIHWSKQSAARHLNRKIRPDNLDLK